jgi:hypothetical protein
MAEINAAFSSEQFECAKRRRLVYVILLFCATVVGYLTVWGTDTALQRDIANALTILAGTTSSSWIFGVVWDDLNARKWGTPTSPEAEVPATERTVSEE